MRNQSLAALLFFFASHAAASDDPLAALKNGQPKDVIELIDRRVGCNHWSGEEAYDAGRKQEIAAAMEDLQCQRLDIDEALARRRYAKKPGTISALKQAKETSY